MTPLESLQRSALFRDFSEAGLRIFAALAREKAIPAGSPLFVENTVGESLFIVTSGTVRVTRREADGERELGLLGAGEHLGAVSLLARSVRLVSAAAATPCEVLELAHADFVRLQPDKPQACLKLAIAIAADLATRVAENRELLRDLPSRGGAGP
jgi:CRP/FNR family cyclic AMP-dependent transcriptional regulator